MMTIERYRYPVRLAGALALVLVAVTPYATFAQPAGIDTEATRLLKASTDFLARQQKFSVEARNSLEIVLTSGQKIQFNHGARQSVQRPNKLRAERTGDLVEQAFYYDGKTLTMINTSNKVYATTVAPDTLEGMLDFAREKLDIV